MNGSRGLLLAGLTTSLVWGCGDAESTNDRTGSSRSTGGIASNATGEENEGGDAGSSEGGLAGSSEGGLAGGPAGAGARGSFGGGPGQNTGGRPVLGVSDAGKALLDLPATISYECGVERELELFGVPWIFGGLVDGGGLTDGGGLVDGAPALLRGVPDPEMSGFAERLLWSPIAPSGALSEASSVHDARGRIYSAGAAARDGRTTIVWAQDTSDTLDAINVFLAQIDDSGAVITKPYAVAASQGWQTEPQIVATSDGYAVMWTEDPDPFRNDANESLRFVQLDRDGLILRGPVDTLDRTRPRVTQLLWTGTTFAATYFDVASDLALNYVAIDEQGEFMGEPILLAANHFASSQPYSAR